MFGSTNRIWIQELLTYSTSGSESYTNASSHPKKLIAIETDFDSGEATHIYVQRGVGSSHKLLASVTTDAEEHASVTNLILMPGDILTVLISSFPSTVSGTLWLTFEPADQR